MKIEKGGIYRTRAGQEVEIYSTDNGGKFPVHGRIKNREGTHQMAMWREDGRVFESSVEDEDDLMPNKIWVSIFDSPCGLGAAVHEVGSEASFYKNDFRYLKTVEVEL